MRRYLRPVLVLGVLVSVLASVGDSSAQVILSTPTDSSKTITSWSAAGAGGMQQQDALYVYGSSTNVDGATNLTFTVFTGVTDIHILTVGAGLSGNANLELKYKLEIAGAPTATLLTASLSATVFGTDGNVTLTERFYSDSSYTTLIPGSTLTTTGGAVSFTFGPGVTQVWIDQTATTTGDGQLTSFSNAEIEGFQSQSGGTTVPEPTSLAIWSVLAGMGVVVGWRRRQKQRCAAGTTA